MSSSQYDVIVVGGGPSGLVTAAEIARYGAKVAVVEKRTGPPVTRAGTLLPRPLELFDARGVADRFVRRTCEVNPHPFTTEHIWSGLHPVDWSDLDSRFGFTLYLAQSETEAILREWAHELGVEIMTGHEVESVTTSSESARVLARSESGDEITIEATYVVGADGARGVVRKSLGIDMEGFDGTFTAVATICEMPFPFPGGYLSTTNERGWLLAFPFGQGVTRLGFVHAEGRETDRSVPVTREEVVRCVSDILGEPFDVPEISEALRYSNARRMASQFRSGRVFLVGEAVRFHYPASGVGMNYCIQDAFNLGWKLGAVVQGSADPALLDTYESERRPVCLDLMDSVDAQVSIQFNFSREGQKFLEQFQSKLLTQPDVTRQLQRELQGLERPYPSSPDSHRAVGHVVPDFEVLGRDGSSARLAELLRTPGPVVLDLSGGRLADASAVEAAGGTVVVGHAVRRPEILRDADVLVVRPDGYLAWAAASPTAESVTAAVARCHAR